VRLRETAEQTYRRHYPTLARTFKGGALVPYGARRFAAIVELPDEHLALVWLRDLRRA
jgi:hypothetical protein